MSNAVYAIFMAPLTSILFIFISIPDCSFIATSVYYIALQHSLECQ
jgi:hypothetical protein